MFDLIIIGGAAAGGSAAIYAARRKLNFKIITSEMGSGITQEKNYFIVTAKNAMDRERKYETKSVIIATGIHPRRIGVPGEKKLYQKGVTYCTVCDGPLFKNKVTATIGSGNSALESALMMTGIAKKVYLLSKYPNTLEKNGGFPKGEAILIDKVKSLPNVEIIYSAGTLEIAGAERVKNLK